MLPMLSARPAYPASSTARPAEPLRFASSSSTRQSRRQHSPEDRFFLASEYQKNPFSIAGKRLARKSAYQQQLADYQKQVSQSRKARFIGAAINWSPWVVYLTGSKVIEKLVGAIPPNATLPGLIVFSIATTPFMAELHEKVMTYLQTPPALLEKKAKLDELSNQLENNEPLQQAESQSQSLSGVNRQGSVLARLTSKLNPFSQSLNYDELAQGLCTALISRYREQQDAAKALLPKLRGRDDTRRYLLPALRKLQEQTAHERSALLPERSADSSLDAIADRMAGFSDQERELLQKSVNLAEERQRYSAHLRRVIPELIQYLDSVSPA